MHECRKCDLLVYALYCRGTCGRRARSRRPPTFTLCTQAATANPYAAATLPHVHRHAHTQVSVQLPNSSTGAVDLGFQGKFEPSRDDLDCVAVFDGTTFHLELMSGSVKCKCVCDRHSASCLEYICLTAQPGGEVAAPCRAASGVRGPARAARHSWWILPPLLRVLHLTAHPGTCGSWQSSRAASTRARAATRSSMSWGSTQGHPHHLSRRPCSSPPRPRRCPGRLQSAQGRQA